MIKCTKPCEIPENLINDILLILKPAYSEKILTNPANLYQNLIRNAVIEVLYFFS